MIGITLVYDFITMLQVAPDHTMLPFFLTSVDLVMLVMSLIGTSTWLARLFLAFQWGLVKCLSALLHSEVDQACPST